MGVWLSPIFFILNQLVSLYILVIFVTVIMSWLLAFGVINRRNPVVAGIDDLCNRLTEPFLRPLRRLLPPIGGLDLSPLILLLIVYAIQMYLGIIESQLLRL
jgi:YggT family protein